MTPRSYPPRVAAGLARRCAVALLLAAAGCGAARHRKVAGPPPEYEWPDVPDASTVDAAPTGGRSGSVP
jgi:hypothetical protein